MGYRLYLNGQLAAEREMRRPETTRPGPRDEVTGAAWCDPVPAGTYPQPLRSGVPWVDPDTGLTYRVVDRHVLRADQGWAGSDFWINELRCTASVWGRLLREGFFDLARTPDGARRYRCMDYARAMDRVRQVLKARHMRGRSERR